MVWVEPVATSKLLGCPHSPHQRGFCTEGLLNRHALDMLGRTWNVCMDMHNTASKSMLQNGSMSKYKLRMLCCAWWSLLPVCISLNTLWSLSIFVVHIRSTENLRIRIHVMHSLWLPCIQCVCLWYYWPWENFQDHIPIDTWFKVMSHSPTSGRALSWSLLSSTSENNEKFFYHILWRGCKAVRPGRP